MSTASNLLRPAVPAHHLRVLALAGDEKPQGAGFFHMFRLAEPLKKVHAVCSHTEKVLIKLIVMGLYGANFGGENGDLKRMLG